jgi:hypothetical protein
MPHAGGTQEAQQDQGGGSATLSERAGKIAEYARENPKAAIAAGAALAAGVVAAAAIPLVRARKSESSPASRSKSGASKSGASGRSKSGSSKRSGSSKKD